jgi:dihydrofolate reductase
MRTLKLSAFVSMDGVMQAPGGPSEDPTGGFRFGGWVAPYGDETIGELVGETFEQDYDLLLGRKTYEIFAGYWPQMDDPIGRRFNAVAKYVAAGPETPMTWANSHRLEGDVAEAVRRLKTEGDRPLLIQGSTRLIQTLLDADLIDEITTLTYPVVLGRGKRLFESGDRAGAWTLTETRVSTSGVIAARYRRAGEVQTGTFAEQEPSPLEIARQARMLREG